MFIREMSDIHLEFGELSIPPMPEDKETVLILGGDLGLVCTERQRETLGRFLVNASVMFRSVIYILGNHEHYNYSYIHTYTTIEQLIYKLGLQNVFLLEHATKVFDNVAFVGATLWTDYDNDPAKMSLCGRAINDHRLITTGTILQPNGWAFTPEMARQEHMKARTYVFNEAKKQKAAGNKVVIVVHHGISYKSVHKEYDGSPINCAFVSALDNEVVEAKADILFHGHTHKQFDYMLGETRVIVNPRGYFGVEDISGFNPTLRVEV